MSNIKLAVYYITAPNQEIATNLSNILLQKKLIACCNIVKDVKSIYTWENKIQNDNQVLMILKSRQSLATKIIQIVSKNHPYDTPEIIGIPIIVGSQKYMKWVQSNTQQ